MEETQNPLSSFSLEDLVKEVKARMQSYESAKAQMLEFVPSTERPVPVAVTQRARYVGTAGVKAKTTGSAVISAAKKLYWAKRKKASKTEIAELERAVEVAKAANRAEKQA